MAQIIPFPAANADEPDLHAMSAPELEQLLSRLRTQVEQLDLDEPADMESEAYEIWGELHEELEDRIDEILDRLDELR